MTRKKIIFSLFAALVSFSALNAQKGKTRLNLAYNVGLPTGSFKGQLDETSFRGFQGSVLYGLSNKLSIGLGSGFQDFYQKTPRQLYKLSDGSDVSAVRSNSIQTLPVLAQVKYAFAPGAVVQPYAALGAGGNLITYSQLLGEFGNQQSKFGFAARPEAGIYIPFKKGSESGFTVGASYNVMPFTELGFKNLNNLGLHAGVSIPLRK
jgi:opacity protein-like surface antigen